MKFQQPIYSIKNFGKGKKKRNCHLINYFQLLFLIKCMVSLLCEDGCVTTMLFYECRHSRWAQFWLSHPRINKKHDAEQQNKGKFGKGKSIGKSFHSVANTKTHTAVKCAEWRNSVRQLVYFFVSFCFILGIFPAFFIWLNDMRHVCVCHRTCSCSLDLKNTTVKLYETYYKQGKGP